PSPIFGFLFRWATSSLEIRKRAAAAAAETSLDLGFLERNVLARDRIVLLERKLVRGRARVLRGDVEEPGSCRAQQLDFLNDLLGHDCSDLKRTLALSARTLLTDRA